MSGVAMQVDLSGRVAVVSGGSSGMGAAISERLAGSGAAVVVGGRNLDRRSCFCRGLGGSCVGVFELDDLHGAGLGRLHDEVGQVGPQGPGQRGLGTGVRIVGAVSTNGGQNHRRVLFDLEHLRTNVLTSVVGDAIGFNPDLCNDRHGNAPAHARLEQSSPPVRGLSRFPQDHRTNDARRGG